MFHEERFRTRLKLEIPTKYEKNKKKERNSSTLSEWDRGNLPISMGRCECRQIQSAAAKFVRLVVKRSYHRVGFYELKLPEVY